ncbi:imidazoleglycerol-phosphate dehydratase [Stygiolobus caldivivus]|uniref:Imidazoleglycerol-phosphate dehydratase n=1 Tax=Stygiolobus caldivivus TaxID=2824673 RepID=A0A8D5U9U7_9CREN|nr:imidazoleglycerol-phosphate dehydratase [Stygiolobus caldivivus]BCU71361.1 imidazoleglycerol-phosphate dehydratase [Stygiolobus caldivivus]
MYNNRSVKKVRETKETKVEVELNIDQKGEVKVVTPVKFFNHMLTTLLYYMNTTSMVIAEDKQCYDDHHVVEDVAITLGEAFKEALGDKKGIRRFANFVIPMDDALVLVAVDISGRGISNVELNLSRSEIGGLATENVFHFFQSFSYHSGVNMHIIQLRGTNTHHVIEASFKALGLSLYEASRIISQDIISLKGSL